MQKYLNPENNERYDFEIDVIIVGDEFFDQNGNKLNVPKTLIPLPEGWIPHPETSELDEIYMMRRACYQSESDPLKIEADYDAMKKGSSPDYTRWIAAVESIKSRYPLPTI